MSQPIDIDINAMELLDKSQCLGFQYVPKCIFFGNTFWADTIEDTSAFYNEVKSKYPHKFKMAPYTGPRGLKPHFYYRPVVVLNLTNEELFYATAVMGARIVNNNSIATFNLRDLDRFLQKPSWQL
ncbi:hypothetical protein [Rhizobium sp. P007]|uniref:hypothetical protein n=1 Tax=Rhizobium sp. P007 TaxID=285908 RepID=UPI001157DFEE|nr:hypothetical protein [Rhizobium sp. P007]CAD7041159.1 hypothetical protein RP007_00715 [Rhizobium sp. P007]